MGKSAHRAWVRVTVNFPFLLHFVGGLPQIPPRTLMRTSSRWLGETSTLDCWLMVCAHLFVCLRPVFVRLTSCVIWVTSGALQRAFHTYSAQDETYNIEVMAGDCVFLWDS